MSGCGARPAEESPPWARIDLWQRSTPESVRVLVPLAMATGKGAVELPSRMPPGTVRALRIPRGRSLSFRVMLGREPYVSFRPLLPGDPACPTVHRIKARLPGSDWTVVADRRAEPGDWPAPENETVDLAQFAGREIELALESADSGAPCDGPGGPTLWGSPAIYHREPQQEGTARAERPTGRPNVILLSFDALRPDALGSYGYEPSVTPALDALAAESDVWLRAFSCFNGTNPSFASMMTGLYGKRHGVYDLLTPLPGKRETLAERLGRSGYATGAIVSVRHLRHKNSGLAQGFGSFRVAPRIFSAELATDLAIDWIADQRQPYFLWLHLFDPHTPHTPPRPYALGLAANGVWGLRPVGSWFEFREPGPVEYRKLRLGAHEALYAGEVAYLDRQVDRLLGFLRSRRDWSDTLLVVISDHGENLLEHGFPFRHVGLWDSTTRVPLMIRWPGLPRPGRRLPGLAQTLDVFPTILGAAGLETPAVDGRDLASWTEEPASGRQRVWAEHMKGYGAMVRTESYLYMRISGHPQLADGPYLYDLRRDPAQEINLAATLPDVTAELDELLSEWLADRGQPLLAPPPADDEDREQLRALGYVTG